MHSFHIHKARLTKLKRPDNGVDGVYIAKTGKPGPRVAIVTSVHGNERAGKEIFEKLVRQGIWLARGEVVLIRGNPRAVITNTRLTEVDLNRSFRTLTKEEQAKSIDELPYEVRRAQELIPYLESCDSLLDLHESHSSPIKPFIICEKQSINLALAVGARAIALNFAAAEPGGTDGWMHKHGKKALCYELGYYTNTSQNAKLGMKAITRFLCAEGLLTEQHAPLFNKLHVRVIEARPGIKRGKEPFTFTHIYRSFDPLYVGDLIGMHGNEKIVAKEHGVIIFPNQEVKPGAEAFSYGKILTIKEVQALRKLADRNTLHDVD